MGIIRIKNRHSSSYDSENKQPAMRVSICTGEKVAGFKDVHTGKFEDVMLIVSDSDLDSFKKKYGIKGEIEKIY